MSKTASAKGVAFNASVLVNGVPPTAADRLYWRDVAAAESRLEKARRQLAEAEEHLAKLKEH